MASGWNKKEKRNLRSVLNFLLYLANDELSTAPVNARALRALGKKGSPVRPVYTSAYVLNAFVTVSKYPTAMAAPMETNLIYGGR